MKIYKFEPHDYDEHYTVLASSPEEALEMLKVYFKKFKEKHGCDDDWRKWKDTTVDGLPDKYELQVYGVGEVIMGEWS